MLAQAFQRIFQAYQVPFVATSKSEVDVTSEEAIAHFLERYRPEYIINCSGYTGVDAAESEQQAAYALNVCGPRNLAKTGIPLVHFSTDYVFDGSENMPYTEDRPLCPANTYGATKALGEKAVLSEHDDVLVLRVSWLFGKEGKNFVQNIARLCRDKAAFSVVDDQRGRPTFADDVVKAVMLLMHEGCFGLYHFANSGETTRYEFASAIHEILGSGGQLAKTTTSAFKAQAERPLYSVLDTEKIEQVFGQKIPSWHNGLLEVVG